MSLRRAIRVVLAIDILFPIQTVAYRVKACKPGGTIMFVAELTTIPPSAAWGAYLGIALVTAGSFARAIVVVFTWDWIRIVGAIDDAVIVSAMVAPAVRSATRMLAARWDEQVGVAGGSGKQASSLASGQRHIVVTEYVGPGARRLIGTAGARLDRAATVGDGVENA